MKNQLLSVLSSRHCLSDSWKGATSASASTAQAPGSHFISTSSFVSQWTAQISGVVLGMGERESVQPNLSSPGWCVRLPPRCSSPAPATPRLSGALSVLCSLPAWPQLCCTSAKNPSAHGGDCNPSNWSDLPCQGGEWSSPSEKNSDKRWVCMWALVCPVCRHSNGWVEIVTTKWVRRGIYNIHRVLCPQS